MKNKWLTVVEYSKKVGKTKAMIYLDIRTGKIPKDRIKKIKIKEQLMIKI